MSQVGNVDAAPPPSLQLFYLRFSLFSLVSLQREWGKPKDTSLPILYNNAQHLFLDSKRTEQGHLVKKIIAQPKAGWRLKKGTTETVRHEKKYMIQLLLLASDDAERCVGCKKTERAHVKLVSLLFRVSLFFIRAAMVRVLACGPPGKIVERYSGD